MTLNTPALHVPVFRHVDGIIRLSEKAQCVIELKVDQCW